MESGDNPESMGLNQEQGADKEQLMLTAVEPKSLQVECKNNGRELNKEQNRVASNIPLAARVKRREWRIGGK